MVDGALLDALEGVARHVRRSDKPFGGIQLILSGAPALRYGHRVSKQSPMHAETCNLKASLLTSAIATVHCVPRRSADQERLNRERCRLCRSAHDLSLPDELGSHITGLAGGQVPPAIKPAWNLP